MQRNAIPPNPLLAGAEKPYLAQRVTLLKHGAGFPHLLLSPCNPYVSRLQMHNLLPLFSSPVLPAAPVSLPKAPARAGGAGRQRHIPAILSWRVTLSRSQTRSQSSGRSWAALTYQRLANSKKLLPDALSGTRSRVSKKNQWHSGESLPKGLQTKRRQGCMYYNRKDQILDRMSPFTSTQSYYQIQQ